MAILTIGETIEVGGLAGPSPEQVYIRAFEIVNGDTVMERTHIAVGNAAGFNLLRTFEVEIVDITQVADAGLYCLSGAGQFFRYQEESWSEIAAAIIPRTRVSSLRLVGGTFYALGPRNGVYFLDRGAWVKFAIPDIGTHILDLIELSADSFLMCGTEGYLATLSGGMASQIDLPTNVALCSLLSHRGQLFVSGHRATLLRGNDDDWMILEYDGADADFLKLLNNEGTPLIAAEYNILKVQGDALAPFADIEAQKLYLIADQLFAKGSESVATFVKGAWSNFPITFEVSDIESAEAVPRQ